MSALPSYSRFTVSLNLKAGYHFVARRFEVATVFFCAWYCRTTRVLRLDFPGRLKAATQRMEARFSICKMAAPYADHIHHIIVGSYSVFARWHHLHRSVSKSHCTVEPLTNDHPHQRPSLSYDHISCDGQWFLFVYESLTSDHPSYTTTPM